MGPTGNISTFLTDTYDTYRASSPLKAGESVKPPSIKVNPNYNPFNLSSAEKDPEAISNSITTIT